MNTAKTNTSTANNGGTPITKQLQNVDRCFQKLASEFHVLEWPEAYNQAVSHIHALTATVFSANQSGLSTERIRQELSYSWEIFGQSSFVGHLQRWPRGYPGDFEAINMIVDRKELSSLDTIGGAIGNYCLNTTIAQQHREKIAEQADMIRYYCSRRKTPKIASIACGASRDTEMAQCEIVTAKAELLLIDFDQAALDESMRRLEGIKEQVTTALANVRQISKLLKHKDKFDLVYAGGLFDYLPTGIILNILSHVGACITPGGCLMFTNAADNGLFRSYKPLIETMADWKLIDRTREEMVALIASTGCREHKLDLDPTGLMWIAKAYF